MFNLFCLILYFFVHRLAIAETIPGERVSVRDLMIHEKQNKKQNKKMIAHFLNQFI